MNGSHATAQGRTAKSASAEKFDPLSIAYFPNWPLNPYQQLFYNALKELGVATAAPCEFSDAWLRQNASNIDALHIHWPESIWRTDRIGLNSLKRLAGLVRFLRLAKSLGLICLWTVHNLEHHEGTTLIDRIGYKILARHCDIIVCHSESTSQSLRKRDRPKGTIVVVPHGNYDGVYPPPAPANHTLSKLGLRSDRITVGVIGMMRRYKGLDVAIDAVKRMATPVQLILAGAPHGDFEATAIRAAADAIPSCAMIAETLTDQQLSDLVAACDYILLPYLRVTGSGAMLMALTFGTPTIASDLPFFRELAGVEPGAVSLFPAGDRAALASTLAGIDPTNLQANKDAALRLSRRYSWNRTVQPLVRELDSVARRMNHRNL